MNYLNFLLPLLVLGVPLLIFFWYNGGRSKYQEFIKPPPVMPLHDFVLETWFEERSETDGKKRVVWLKTPTEVQPQGDVKCVAYSLHELMEMPPIAFGAKTPAVDKLFEAVAERDDQKNNSRGAAVIGAMNYLEQNKIIGKTGFLKTILRRLGFRHAFFNFNSREQMIEYVATYSPFIAGISLQTEPHVSTDGFFYAMEGDHAFDHAVLVYGVDESIKCPDDTIGAFKILWHTEMLGYTEGWMPFALFDRIHNKNWTYGYKI